MAIKIEDLRVGNLVYTPNIVEVIIVLSDLTGIIEDGLVFEPIPLTDEWLLRFGFKIKTDENLFSDAFFGENPITQDWLLKLTYTGEGWFYRNAYFKINYVHQLQNLFYALCGKELIHL